MDLHTDTILNLYEQIRTSIDVKSVSTQILYEEYTRPRNLASGITSQALSMTGPHTHTLDRGQHMQWSRGYKD